MGRMLSLFCFMASSAFLGMFCVVDWPFIRKLGVAFPLIVEGISFSGSESESVSLIGANLFLVSIVDGTFYSNSLF